MKKVLIALIIVIVLIISYLLWYYTSSADDEIHLLPNNFTGIVIIRFDSKNGTKKYYEQGKRVYQIPESGVLETEFKHNDGWSSPPQFYYLEGDKRIPINKQNTNVQIHSVL